MQSTANPNQKILFFKKREKAAFSAKKVFSFSKKKSPLLLLSYLFFSSKVTLTRSIHKYTQPVMLTHYSLLRG